MKTAALLAATVAAWVVVTVATAPAETVDGTPHAAAVTVSAWPGVAEGYHGDYTDGSLADWDCAHGRQPSGYGAPGQAMMFDPCARLDPRTIVDHRHPDYTDAHGTAWSWVSDEAGYEPTGAN